MCYGIISVLYQYISEAFKVRLRVGVRYSFMVRVRLVFGYFVNQCILAYSATKQDGMIIYFKL